jgi:hypothetical protein
LITWRREGWEQSGHDGEWSEWGMGSGSFRTGIVAVVRKASKEKWLRAVFCETKPIPRLFFRGFVRIQRQKKTSRDIMATRSSGFATCRVNEGHFPSQGTGGARATTLAENDQAIRGGGTFAGLLAFGRGGWRSLAPVRDRIVQHHKCILSW